MFKIYVLRQCFLKNENCSNLEFSVSKNYRQIVFTSEIFKYKKPPLFQLWAVELANLFYWYLHMSPWLNANGNSTKAPISNTNFSNKVQISESYHKIITLTGNFKLLCSLTVEWRPFQFLAKFVKICFHWLMFSASKIRYFHLLMCLLHAKGNTAAAISGSRKFWYENGGPFNFQWNLKKVHRVCI